MTSEYTEMRGPSVTKVLSFIWLKNLFIAFEIQTLFDVVLIVLFEQPPCVLVCFVLVVRIICCRILSSKNN
jgi:hypothetical protein